MVTLRQTEKDWLMVLLPAMLFGIAHSTNANFSLMGCGNIILAGILLGLLALKSGQLWLGIGFHISWNFFQGCVFGFGVIGISTVSYTHLEVDLECVREADGENPAVFRSRTQDKADITYYFTVQPSENGILPPKVLTSGYLPEAFRYFCAQKKINCRVWYLSLIHILNEAITAYAAEQRRQEEQAAKTEEEFS